MITTASNLQINTIIGSAANNAFGLTKNGNGILDLSNGNISSGGQKGLPNTFTGGITINGGVVIFGNDTTGATNLGFTPTSYVANNITLNGGGHSTARRVLHLAPTEALRLAPPAAPWVTLA